VTSTVAETRRADAFGGISRDKNTRRLFVSPADFKQLAVTGTWALEANSNVVSLATDDAGTTNLLMVPFPGEYSDLIVKGSTEVDRGLKVIALEVIYEVAVSALGDVDIFLYKTTFDSEGAGTAALVATTTTLDGASDTGREADQHRMTVTIAERDRFFLDGGTMIHGIFDVDDGTASDVNILGAIWHVQRVEE
jgi:hypothetical protein